MAQSVIEPRRHRQRSPGRWLRRFVYVAPLLIAWAGASLIVRRKAAEADLAWQGLAVTPATYARDHPGLDTNGAAAAIEAAARAARIEISPRGPGVRDVPERWTDLDRERKAWLHCELEGRGPGASRAILADSFARSGALDDLVATMQSLEAPVWKRPLVVDVITESDNRVDQVRMQETVAARLLLAEELGDRTLDPAATLAAAARFNQNLYARGTLSSTLFAIAITRLQLGVARRVDGLTPAWLDANLAPDASGAVRTAIVPEAWRARVAGRARGGRLALDYIYGAGREPWLARWLVVSVMAPVTKYSLLELQRVIPDRLAALRGLGACEDIDALRERIEADRPPWRSLEFDLVDSAARAARLELDRELTRLILELREQRRQSGRWPEALSDRSVRSCPGRVWEYATTAGGHLRVSLGGEPPWAPRTGLVLPLVHEE